MLYRKILDDNSCMERINLLLHNIIFLLDELKNKDDLPSRLKQLDKNIIEYKNILEKRIYNNFITFIIERSLTIVDSYKDIQLNKPSNKQFQEFMINMDGESFTPFICTMEEYIKQFIKIVNDRRFLKFRIIINLLDQQNNKLFHESVYDNEDFIVIFKKLNGVYEVRELSTSLKNFSINDQYLWLKMYNLEAIKFNNYELNIYNFSDNIYLNNLSELALTNYYYSLGNFTKTEAASKAHEAAVINLFLKDDFNSGKLFIDFIKNNFTIREYAILIELFKIKDNECHIFYKEYMKNQSRENHKKFNDANSLRLNVDKFFTIVSNKNTPLEWALEFSLE